MNDEHAKERIHMWVTGRVQGVGCRAYVQSNALPMGVTGWVRNVGYDTVETVFEGSAEQVARFLAMVKRGPTGSRVDEAREERGAATGEFNSFGVKSSV